MRIVEDNYLLKVLLSNGNELEYLVPKQRKRYSGVIGCELVHFETFSKKEVFKFISDNIISKNIIELNDTTGSSVYLNASHIIQFKIL